MAATRTEELSDLAKKLVERGVKSYTPYASEGAFFLRVEVRLPEPRVFKLKFTSAARRDQLRGEVKKWRNASLVGHSQS